MKTLINLLKRLVYILVRIFILKKGFSSTINTGCTFWYKGQMKGINKWQWIEHKKVVGLHSIRSYPDRSSPFIFFRWKEPSIFEHFLITKGFCRVFTWYTQSDWLARKHAKRILMKVSIALYYTRKSDPRDPSILYRKSNRTSSHSTKRKQRK